MNEERRLLLEMISKGEISVDDGERLLGAIPERPAEPPVRMRAGVQPRKLAVLVTKEGRKTVNIRMPFGLLRPALKLGKAGMAFSGRWSENNVDMERIMQLLDEIDLDEILESLSDGETTLPCTIVDVVEDEGQHVQITLE
jgi:hypothetical protein